MSKAKLVVWVLTAQALLCFLIWHSLQMSKITGSVALAFCLTAFLSGIVLQIFSDVPKLLIFVEVICSAVAANIANIVYGRVA